MAIHVISYLIAIPSPVVAYIVGTAAAVSLLGAQLGRLGGGLCDLGRLKIGQSCIE